MSRRSRRRNNQASRHGVWWGRAACGLLLSCVLAGIGGYAWLKTYLHSDAFRKMLSATVGETLGMKGEFGLFRWDGMAVDTDNFMASGGGPIGELAAERIHTEVNLSAVRRGVWELRGATVGRTEVKLDLRAREPQAAPEAAPRAKARAGSGWLPSRVEIGDLDLREVAVTALLDSGVVRGDGLRVRMEHAGRDTYSGEISGGLVRGPLPDIRLERLRFRGGPGGWFVTDAAARMFKDGRLECSGEIVPGGGYAFEGSLVDVKCDELLNPDWAKHLTGDFVTTVMVQNGEGGPVVRGEFAISKGTLTALPVLDALAAYADTSRLRLIVLSEARGNWKWRQGEWEVSNLVFASEGLVRMEGSLTVRGRALDGRFRLGLAPGTLAAIPGAETVVFLPGERGLLWSPLAITGTLDEPREDLSDRLAAAARDRMFEVIPETGLRVLKFTRSAIQDGRPIEKGVEVIDQAADTILRQGGGLIDGILGGGSPPSKPPPAPDPPADP